MLLQTEYGDQQAHRDVIRLVRGQIFVPAISFDASVKDYLYDLAKAVRKLAPESHDSHLDALEVRKFSFKFHGQIICAQIADKTPNTGQK